MKRPPTDFELLKAIHERHLVDFKRLNQTFIPIDIPAIADDLGVETNSVFGRLYFHLEEIYGRAPTPLTKKSFFAPRVGEDANCRRALGASVSRCTA